MKALSVLGSTGSIGTQTLELAEEFPDRFRVVALTAGNNLDLLVSQIQRHAPEVVALANAERVSELRERLQALEPAARPARMPELLGGSEGLCAAAAWSTADLVVTGIVGCAGLLPTLAAIRAGKDLALANKETLIAAGPVVLPELEKSGSRLLPADSEHSAIFQCLPEDRRTWAERIDHIVLTASGGPFRTRDPATLHSVTPEEAIAHPNWVMGRKISVDSATMMNKALEVIEARWLFDLAPEQVRVVLHPQSIIHSMVVCRDNSVLAQLGTPDMKVPISVGLAWPGREASGADPLDFLSCKPLTFEPADHQRFPGLGLAYDALRAPEGSTTVLNAANEVAVAAFLAGSVRFTDIHRINADAVSGLLPTPADAATLDDLLALDARARRHAQALAKDETTMGAAWLRVVL